MHFINYLTYFTYLTYLLTYLFTLHVLIHASLNPFSLLHADTCTSVHSVNSPLVLTFYNKLVQSAGFVSCRVNHTVQL